MSTSLEQSLQMLQVDKRTQYQCQRLLIFNFYGREMRVVLQRSYCCPEVHHEQGGRGAEELNWWPEILESRRELHGVVSGVLYDAKQSQRWHSFWLMRPWWVSWLETLRYDEWRVSYLKSRDVDSVRETMMGSSILSFSSWIQLGKSGSRRALGSECCFFSCSLKRLSLPSLTDSKRGNNQNAASQAVATPPSHQVKKRTGKYQNALT